MFRFPRETLAVGTKHLFTHNEGCSLLQHRSSERSRATTRFPTRLAASPRGDAASLPFPRFFLCAHTPGPPPRPDVTEGRGSRKTTARTSMVAAKSRRTRSRRVPSRATRTPQSAMALASKALGAAGSRRRPRGRSGGAASIRAGSGRRSRVAILPVPMPTECTESKNEFEFEHRCLDAERLSRRSRRPPEAAPGSGMPPSSTPAQPAFRRAQSSPTRERRLKTENSGVRRQNEKDGGSPSPSRPAEGARRRNSRPPGRTGRRPRRTTRRSNRRNRPPRPPPRGRCRRRTGRPSRRDP